MMQKKSVSLSYLRLFDNALMEWGESYLVAKVFARRMARIGYYPIVIDAVTESLALAEHSDEEDVALFISYSGSGIVTYLNRGEVQTLRDHGCKTIVVTSNKNLKGFDHIVLYPHNEDENENLGTFYSTAAANYLLSVIYSILFSRDYTKLKKEKDQDDSKLRKFIRYRTAIYLQLRSQIIYR